MGVGGDYLVIISDTGLGRRYRLGDTCVIGRQSDCDAQLVDPGVSKQHARLARDAAGGFLIEDLGSRNGVTVNGERLAAPRRLQPNDVIGVGGCALLFNPNFEVLPEDDEATHAVLLTSEDDVVGTSLEPNAAPITTDGLLCELLRRLAAAPPRDSFATLLEGLRREVPFDAAAVLEGPKDAMRPLFVSASRRTLSVSRSIVEAARRSSAGIVVPDALGDAHLGRQLSIIRGKVRSAIAVSLEPGREGGGVLYLVRDEPRAYDGTTLAHVTRATPTFAVALNYRRALEGTATARLPAGGGDEAAEILGQSDAAKALRHWISKAARAPATALILGESGTGKELVARALHREGVNPAGPFIAINCGALPEHLIESELFGHERGAFTGASSQRLGRLELAANGTLFLDEIGELPLNLQVRLLRALEERTFYRVGGVRPVAARFRLLAATHRDLAAMVASGQFRQDLYFRLNVLCVTAPPLRERADDIVDLATHFVRVLGREHGSDVRDIEPRALARLRRYPWPGNIRELRNVIERALVLGVGPTLGEDDLPEELRAPPPSVESEAATLPAAVAQLERERIIAALRECRGKKSHAAKALGISRPTLDKKIRDFGIDLFGGDR